MRPIINLALLLFFAVRLSAQSPGVTLSGIVADSLTGKPLDGISVFLNSTSRGTTTHSNGQFQLTVPRGTYQLVFSAIGYSTTVVTVSDNHLPTDFRIKLKQQATELAAVTVEPYEKRGWAKYGRFFWTRFIGTGANASSCTILNKEVLRFYFYKRSNRLNVTAKEPLIIENNALGYVLEYRLEGFVSDFNTNIVTYFGYPFFREMTPKKEGRQQTWAEQRYMTYRGSMMHFMRSLYAGHSIRESFFVQRRVTIPNAEKHRVKRIYRPDFQSPGLFPIDTLHYFWTVLREPELVTMDLTIDPDSLVSTRPDQSKALYFDGQLTVTYGVNNANDSLRQSGIRLISAQPITVEENGNYYPSKEILTSGFWGQSEKIANLLPLDYQPVPPRPPFISPNK